jgi:hypothetical protein
MSFLLFPNTFCGHSFIVVFTPSLDHAVTGSVKCSDSNPHPSVPGTALFSSSVPQSSQANTSMRSTASASIGDEDWLVVREDVEVVDAEDDIEKAER